MNKFEYKDSLGRPMPLPPTPSEYPPSSIPSSQARVTRKHVVGCLLMLPMFILFVVVFMSSIGWDRFLEVVATTFIAAIILILFVAGLGSLVSEN